MSARDVISDHLEWLGVPDNRWMVNSLMRALTASGYRIIGPDELDPVTVEKCAAVAETEGVHPHLNQFAEWYVHAKRIATTIRALCVTHQGDK